MESQTLIPTFSLREKGLISSPLRERTKVRVERIYQNHVDMVLVDFGKLGENLGSIPYHSCRRKETFTTMAWSESGSIVMRYTHGCTIYVFERERDDPIGELCGQLK